MNAKLWVCVIAGVLVVHLCVIMILDTVRTSRTPPPPRPIEPNFSTSTTTVRAPDGTEIKVVNEFTVETEFATPEVLAKLPAAPSAEVKPAAPDTPQPEKSILPATAN